MYNFIIYGSGPLLWLHPMNICAENYPKLSTGVRLGRI